MSKTTGASPSPGQVSPAHQIEAIIAGVDDWRGPTLARLRAVILKADPRVIEEVKWKKPSNPMGVPVWSHQGIVCVGEVLKSAVRLTFAHGVRLKDPTGLFNTRLDSKTVRAIDYRQGDRIDAAALKALVRAGAVLNAQTDRARRR